MGCTLFKRHPVEEVSEEAQQQDDEMDDEEGDAAQTGEGEKAPEAKPTDTAALAPDTSSTQAPTEGQPAAALLESPQALAAPSVAEPVAVPPVEEAKPAELSKPVEAKLVKALPKKVRGKGKRHAKAHAHKMGKGKGMNAAVAFDEMSYVVRQGDTLSRIATKIYGSSAKWKDLANLNTHIKNANLIFPGDVIKIKADNETSVAFMKTYKEKQDASKVVEVVRKGDTLEKIAKRKLGDGSVWKYIWSNNRSSVGNPHKLEVGTKLQFSTGLFSPQNK